MSLEALEKEHYSVAKAAIGLAIAARRVVQCPDSWENVWELEVALRDFDTAAGRVV